MDVVNDLLERQSGDGLEKHLGKSLPLGGVAPGPRNLDIIVVGHKTVAQVRTLGRACGESAQDQHLEAGQEEELEKLRRQWDRGQECFRKQGVVNCCGGCWISREIGPEKWPLAEVTWQLWVSRQFS